MIDAAFLGVLVVGLAHGLDPGHGWPVAVVYAAQYTRPAVRALASSSVISLFHLLSSIAVLGVYILLKTLLQFSLPYVNYVAGTALAILGIRFFLHSRKGGLDEQHGHLHADFASGEHEHEHEHPSLGRHTHGHRHVRRVLLTLSGVASFAFVLGFAHEEGFVLLALAVGGIDPLALMLTYAGAVALGLIGITIFAVRLYRQFLPNFSRYEQLLPKVSGAVLLLMALTFLLGLR